jgi:carbamoyl-phosphate synthase large subunit
MIRSDKCTVVVTGVGAIIGQGIIKSLRRLDREIRIVGIDRSDNSPGPHLVDHFYRKPTVDESSEEYLDFWLKLLSSSSIGLILPALEEDLFFLNKHRTLLESKGVKVALNSDRLISKFSNKWLLGQELIAIGYPSIPSIRSIEWFKVLEKLGDAPFLLKPLLGNGSRGIVRLKTETDLDYWNRIIEYDWMIQKIVGNDQEEFTVGVFGLGHGKYVKPIIFRRLLSAAGNTQYVEVVSHHDVIEKAVERLCQHFCPLGPTNFQFRTEGNTAYLLEINARFSSSNSLRTAFGYNESKMAIDFYLNERTPDTPSISKGKGWRYSEDFIVYDRATV